MEFTYSVLFDDNEIETVSAYDISDAWEKALNIGHAGKIVDVWCE